MSAEHHPNATATVYSLQFCCLLEILWDKRATEPCLTTRNHAEWLTWAHGARWLVRMLFDSPGIPWAPPTPSSFSILAIPGQALIPVALHVTALLGRAIGEHCGNQMPEFPNGGGFLRHISPLAPHLPPLLLLPPHPRALHANSLPVSPCLILARCLLQAASADRLHTMCTHAMCILLDLADQASLAVARIFSSNRTMEMCPTVNVLLSTPGSIEGLARLLRAAQVAVVTNALNCAAAFRQGYTVPDPDPRIDKGIQWWMLVAWYLIEHPATPPAAASLLRVLIEEGSVCSTLVLGAAQGRWGRVPIPIHPLFHRLLSSRALSVGGLALWAVVFKSPVQSGLIAFLGKDQDQGWSQTNPQKGGTRTGLIRTSP
ncbi:hypothetical protein FOMPIDRAFT_1055684 [Fomitopsis schrenkii]|uniref:Uncharacterized protein n=1 Tax=Fomitopsis schrenkii TaxID=2126942 RepID=S8DRH2_FOMSC|nr:hypothetical protein FOMPIDRAFT_1055684 [Fomitopsis schrenkii]